VLNEVKQKLGVLNEESEFLKNETAARREALSKINDEVNLFIPLFMTICKT